MMDEENQPDCEPFFDSDPEEGTEDGKTAEA